MRLLISILFICVTLSVSAQFSLQGKLRTLRPLTIKVTDLVGNTIVEYPVKSDKEFKTKPVNIREDLYIFHIGDYTEQIILTNNVVSMNGFLNDQKPEDSTLEFEGIDLHMKLLEIMGQCKEQVFKKEVFKNFVEKDESLEPVIRGALMYLNKIYLGHDYESYKRVLDLIPEDGREAQVVKYLVDEVTKRQSIAIGTQAYDFTFVDVDGNEVSLSDFWGKFVLLDFSASWCGGCRLEAKKLIPIYDKLKGDDLVFISISLDNREKDWRRMVKEDQLPWVTLWDSEGFTKGNKPNKVQAAYGFYQIPFLVLIDKDGKIIARDLRGEKVKEAIEKAREGKL